MKSNRSLTSSGLFLSRSIEHSTVTAKLTFSNYFKPRPAQPEPRSHSKSRRNQAELQFHSERIATLLKQPASSGVPDKLPAKSLLEKQVLKQLREDDLELQTKEILVKERELELLNLKSKYSASVKVAAGLSEGLEQLTRKIFALKTKLRGKDGQSSQLQESLSFEDPKELAVLHKALRAKDEEIRLKLQGVAKSNQKQLQALVYVYTVRQQTVEQKRKTQESLHAGLGQALARLEEWGKARQEALARQQEAVLALKETPQHRQFQLEQSLDTLAEQHADLEQQTLALEQRVIAVREGRPSLGPHLGFLKELERLVGRWCHQLIMRQVVDEEEMERLVELGRVNKLVEGKEHQLKVKQVELQQVLTVFQEQSALQSQLRRRK